MTDDRAVSEVLGYVLIFALVTATVGMVFTIGIGGLESAQQAEQVNNVERAFDVLAHNFEDMHRRESPSRATEIRLTGGTLGIDDPVNVTIVSETDSDVNASIYPAPIVYESDGGSQIVYEGGAVFRTDGDSNVMIREPEFVSGENHTILTVVRTMRSPGSESRIGGQRIILISGTYRGGSLYLSEENSPVNVTIRSPRADAWGRYFESQDAQNVNVTDDEVTFEIEPDRLSVIRTRINVELIS